MRPTRQESVGWNELAEERSAGAHGYLCFATIRGEKQTGLPAGPYPCAWGIGRTGTVVGCYLVQCLSVAYVMYGIRIMEGSSLKSLHPRHQGHLNPLT
jgi:hypothetical protein